MKTAVVVLLVTTLVGVHAAGASVQNPTRQEPIIIRLDRIPLSRILDLVARWAKVDFVIAPADVEGKTVTVHLENPTLTQVLDAIFQPIGLNYQVDDNRVVVRSR